MSPDEHDIMRAVEDDYWWYQALRQHVADSIEPPGPAFSVLDAGCGTGGTLAAVRRHFPQAELTGTTTERRRSRSPPTHRADPLAPRARLPLRRLIRSFALTFGATRRIRVAPEENAFCARGEIDFEPGAFEFLKGAPIAPDVDGDTERQVQALLEARLLVEA